MIEKIKTLLNSIFIDKNITKHDLVIFDDFFPHLLSAFRISEFNYLLKHFSHSAVYSNLITIKAVGDNRGFDEVCREYSLVHKDVANKVFFYDRKKKLKANLCYLMFLNNASYFIDYIEKCCLPFVVELYPGGGFCLNDNDSDNKLRRIIKSPYLRKIITTQMISYNYILENKFCTKDKIELIYGGVTPQDQLKRELKTRKIFPESKDTFDICFVAQKYMPKGRDKGYDIFIEVARILSSRCDNFNFHVVGPFDANEISISGLEGKIKFYGSCTTDFFPSFYSGIDLILSPNVPFVLSPGAFDGFPTGACVEAALCGVAVFCCDELKLNQFINGEEIVVIPHDVDSIVESLFFYYNNSEQLYNIAKNGQVRFRDAFSYDKQMAPRIKLLEELM